MTCAVAPAGRITFHRFAITAADREVARLAGLITDDERVRAAGYRRVSDRVRFIVARARLRIVLARECGRSPSALRFAYGRHGKPWLPTHPELRFSLSHAGDAALVAVARGGEVGVDLEPARRQGNLAEVATRFFSAAERDALAALDESARPAAILRCWCRKEAYVKARGDGLARPLDSFDVAVGPVAGGASVLTATRPDETEAAAWHVRDLDVGAGWVAAVASAVALGSRNAAGDADPGSWHIDREIGCGNSGTRSIVKPARKRAEYRLSPAALHDRMDASRRPSQLR